MAIDLWTDIGFQDIASIIYSYEIFFSFSSCRIIEFCNFAGET